MVDSIKITALQDIGANIAYTTLVPLVNMAGTPTTQKANLQILGNLILNGAGGSYFAPAARAISSQVVTNAAQPNITSVGTLTSLTVTGNITAGNVNGGNIVVANFYYGDGGFLTNVTANGTYSNSNVANYLPTFTGNVGAGNVNVTSTVYTSGISSTGLASLTILNVSTTANLGAVGNIRITGGTSGQKLTTDGAGNLSWTNDANSSYGNSNVATFLAAFGSNTITTTGNISAGNVSATTFTGALSGAATTAGTVTTAAQPNITSVGTLTSLGVTGNIGGGNVLTSAQVIANGVIDSGTGLTTGGYLSVDGNTDLHNTVVTGNLSATGNITANNLGNISAINLTGSTSNVLYGNGVFAAVPAPTVAQDITSNGAMSIMLYDGNIKYNNYATVEPSSGNIAGGNISASGNVTANNFIGNGNTLSNVATKTSGSWTLASGVNTVSINVPLNGTYAIWINGNIPNGIVTYTATAVVTNTNVPVLGEQYAWYYALGNALVLTSIPDQFVGTVGSISNVNTYAGNTANVFTFGITNNSGNTAVVNYGYTKF